MSLPLFIKNQANRTRQQLFAIILCVLVVATSCAKKQRTLFVFSEDDRAPLKKLTLPAVRNVLAQRQLNGIAVSWHPLDTQQLPRIENERPVLLGYHVYRMTQKNFIHLTPITSQPLQVATFIDPKIKRISINTYYGVRAVFLHNGMTILGPLSHLAPVH